MSLVTLSGSSGSFNNSDGDTVTYSITGDENSSSTVLGIGYGDGDGTAQITFSQPVAGFSSYISVLSGNGSASEELFIILDGQQVSVADLIASGDASVTGQLATSGDAVVNDGSAIDAAGALTINVPFTTIAFDLEPGVGVPNGGNGITFNFAVEDTAPILPDQIVDGEDFGEVMGPDYDDSGQTTDGGEGADTISNGFQPIRWIGMTPTFNRAIRIKAGALGNTRDLVVSPRHHMVLDGWQLERLFDHKHARVTARELVNDNMIVRDAMTCRAKARKGIHKWHM